MKQFTSHDTVDAGLYFNPRSLRFRSMEDRGPLPGAAGETYYRVAPWLLLTAGPLIGLVYLVFLPLIGLVMVGTLVVRALARWITEAATAFARVTRPTWRPVTAFLSRVRHRKPGERHDDQWSDRVDKELADDDDRHR